MCVCCDCRKMNRYSECVYYGCVYLCVCVGELQNSLVKSDSESGTTITLILWHCATRYPAYITSENNRRTFSICKMRFSAIYHGLPCIWMRHAVFHAFNCRSCNNKFYDSALHVENGGDCVLVWCMLVVYAQCSDETTHIIHVRIYVFVQKRDVQTIAEVSIQPCSFHTHTFRSRSHSTNIHISVWRIFTCVCGSALYAMCDPLVPLSLYPAHTHADKYTQNSNDNVQFTSTYHFEILINIFVNGEW